MARGKGRVSYRTGSLSATLAPTLAQRLVKGDSGRDGHVQAGDGPLHRQAQAEVALLKRQAPQSLALRPHDDRERPGEVGREKLLLPVAGGSSDPQPRRLHVAQRPREVRHLGKWHGLCGPGRDFADNGREAGGPVARRDHGRRAGGIGGAQAGAEVVRIRHAVEHQHERRRRLSGEQVEQRFSSSGTLGRTSATTPWCDRAAGLLVERRGRRGHRPQSPRGGELAQLPNARVVSARRRSRGAAHRPAGGPAPPRTAWRP